MNPRQLRRRKATNDLIDSVAISEFRNAHGNVELAPVAVVIAAYKERENVAGVLATMPKTLCGRAVSVIVVVDGEDDGTSAIVRTAGHFAVIAPVNRGQGAALALGYRVAREFGAEFIVTADADGQTDPLDLGVVLEPVVAGVADFVNGSRRLGVTHSTDTVRNLGVFCYASLITVLARTKVTDTANPIRAMRADFTATLTLDEPQYQASELLIGAIMNGARYTERPVTMRTRTGGVSKKGGNLAYGMNYGRVVFRTWWRERQRLSAAGSSDGNGGQAARHVEAD